MTDHPSSDGATNGVEPARRPRDGRKPRSTEKGLAHYLGLALSGAILVLVLALAALVVVIPKVAGGIPLTVLTSSMIPKFPPGTLIVDVPVKTDELRIGDVATYQIVSGKPGVITHRIIAIHNASDGTRTFQFKGDNNSQPDAGEILAEQVQGRVWYSLPYIGYVNNAVNGENRVWIVPVIAGLLFAYAAYTVASAIVSSRRQKRRRARRTASAP
ncbi:signal peptidase I [Lacisediminihabitans sp. FW035]